MKDLYYSAKWWFTDLRLADVLVIAVMGIVEIGVLVAVVVASLQG